MAARRKKRAKKPRVKLIATTVCCLLIAVVLVLFFVFSRTNTPPKTPAVAKLGTPTSEWRLSKVADNHQIEGYTSSDSVVPGEEVNFKISCQSGQFTASIYRMGWYGGKGALRVSALAKNKCQKEAIPTPSKSTGLVNASWPVTFRLSVSPNWPSGIYLAKLTGDDGFQNYVPFTVRPLKPKSSYLFVHAINTDLAYNLWGGNSLYTGSAPELKIDRAVEASLNRPFRMPNNGYDGSGNFLTWEYPMAAFLDRNGYKVDYATDIDIQKNPSLLLDYKAVIITGHNEYWSRQMRDGYDAAVAHGVNLAVFGANTAFRPVRFAQDPLTGKSDRIMINYKSAELDPVTRANPQDSTPAGWKEPPLSRPESELLGLSYEGETSAKASASGDLLVNDASSWIFKDSGLKNGDKIAGVVGYEYDRLNNSFPHPSNLDVVFHSPLINYHDAADYADSAYYILPSGGQVFDAGTIEWSWGLDPSKSTYSPQLVRITKNILNRFGG